MKKLLAIVFCTILTLIFASCGLRNAVEIVSFNPSGSVGTLTTFTIEFSKELAPADSLDKWLTDEFIKFEPKIPGKFKWTSASTLIFSPDVQLEPIQEYSAEITKKVLFNKDLSLDTKTIEFKTHDFDINKVDLFWTHIPNQYYKVSVQANLHFNYPVNPDMLKNHLVIQHDGKQLTNYQIVTNDKSEIIAVNFGEIQQTDKEQDFTIIVKKGLVSVFGKQGLEDDRTFSNKLEPITKLAITGVASGFDGTTGWIEVATTQMVDEKRLKDYVRTEPWKDLSFFVNDNSFRMEANLENVQDLMLKIKKGLPGLYGGELEFDFEQQVSFVNLEPSINFADKKGKYLMMGGNKNLQVNFVNIDEADIEVSQVFKNNLLWFLNQNSYSYDYDEDYGYNSEIWTGDYGKTLYEEKINLKNNKNWLEKKYINLNKLIGQKYKGIYVVNVRSAQDRWIADAKMLAMTDIGIIAKKSGNEILVFVNSIAKAEPIEGVEISIISTNNQTLLSGKTDKEGIVRFADVKKITEGFTPRLVVAETKDDFNYIDLQETFIETSRFDVGGVYEYLEDVNTFIYSDRNIYRPGENVYLSAIIRNDRMEIVKDIPVFLKIITPSGRTFTEMKKILNEEGSFEASFRTPEYVQTGEYRAEVYTGTNQLIGTYKFSVEDFVPDKIRMMLKSDKEFAFPGDIIGVNIDAEFLFGAKASELKYESHINLRHRPFASKKYPDYEFNNSSMTNPIFEEVSKDGYLDANGKGKVEYTVPKDISGSGIVTCYTYVNVFDLTGRTVNRASTVDIYPKNYYIGLKSSGYYYGTNERLNFKTAIVDHSDKPIKGFNATVKLVRYEWQTVLKKDYNDRYFYVSEEKDITEWQKNMNLNGGTKDISFSVTKSGRYELRVSKEGEDEYQKKSFYAYGWVNTTASSFQVDKEGRVDIVFDKAQYEPGDKAKILFMCPFAGKLLVSFERNGVYEYRYIEMENKSVEIAVPVKDEFMPNVYVSATLFKKHTVDNSTPFLVGHGYASMKVEKSSNKLPVKIIAPDKIKPNTSQIITVKTASERNIFVTLAAVDEGILQVKNFKTPDPYGFMYAKRGLKVESYDLYKLLLPEIIGSSSSGGGDDEMFAEMLKKRTNPITTKRFKLFAFWSGILKTNGSGEVKIPINFPQFNGEVRLMAVAYSGSKFGSAEKPMKVADDLIIEPEIPRFLAQDDSLVMPVTLINTTSTKGKANVNVKVEGPLKIISRASQYAEIEPNATKQVVFALKSYSEIGTAKIVIETNGMAKVKEDIDISVRPVSPFLTYTGAGTIKGGASQSFNVPGGFLYGTQNSTLTISKFPAVKFAKQLRELVGYPHGCIEQTISKLFPQIYFAELSQLVAPDYFKTYNPVYYVKEGIRKVEAMQMYDGSMAYWPGGTYPNWWGSVYAAHFLLEAKKAGFDVKDDVLKNLLYYLQKKARERSTYEYYTYIGNKTTVIKIANKEILYSLYVLALAGKGDISTMNYYKSRINLVSADSKYLLAGAFALMGKWSSYNELLPKNYKPEYTYRESGGCFDSEIRANALMLEILLEVEPNNPQIPYIVKYLVQKIDNVYSTQENAFVFMALGKAASSKAKNDVKVEVFIGKKNIGNYTGKDLTLTDGVMNGASIYLKGTGNGEVFYFWSTEGIKANSFVKEEDMYMRVRRNYYDYRTKGEISNNQFYQGQLIVCKISLTGLERSAENIVITDMLPSGFEIENPRLSVSADLSWQNKNPMNVDYMDVRDDRMILFTKLWTGATKEFTYLIRVVNQGRFRKPVIGAEAMYNPEYHSYNGAGMINVARK
ncbi:MAG: alpha-2-macroglobulin family protein [Ignavibacteriae bacterium]|nr:alpha-2-macroglobulin family protein [Ignavibacteriota bacterium]